MRTFRPRRSSWLLLLAISAPFAALGLTDLIINPEQWLVAMACIAGSAALVGFNSTARILITNDHVEFKRYGRLVWCAPRERTELRDGFGGDMPFIPAHVFWHDGRKVGYLLKSWFDPETIGKVREALAI